MSLPPLCVSINQFFFVKIYKDSGCVRFLKYARITPLVNWNLYKTNMISLTNGIVSFFIVFHFRLKPNLILFLDSISWYHQGYVCFDAAILVLSIFRWDSLFSLEACGDVYCHKYSSNSTSLPWKIDAAQKNNTIAEKFL